MAVSGIELTKQGTPTPEPASEGTVRLEGDANGRPRLVDDEGNVAGVGAPGEPLSLAEQTTPPTTTVDELKVYAKRVGGELKLYMRNESNGDEQEVGAGGAPTLDWKNGTPGNPYVAGDEVDAAHNSIIMCQVEDPDSVQINLPEITPGSAGQRIGIRNIINKKAANPGFVALYPTVDDQLGQESDVGQSKINDPAFIAYDIESDGIGRWTFVGFGYENVVDWPIPV